MNLQEGSQRISTFKPILNEVTGIILCGGNGNRLRSITKGDIPKPLVPILKGRTLLDFAVAPLVQAGVGKLIFAAAYRADLITEHVRSQSYADRATVSVDSLQGPSAAIRAAIDENNVIGPTVILHADTVFPGLDLSAAYKFHTEQDANITIVAIPTDKDYPQDTAFIIRDKDNNALARVDEVEEKKSGLEEPTIMSGMLICSPGATAYIRSSGELPPNTDFLTDLSQIGRTKVYLVFDSIFANVNRPETLEALQETLS